MNGSNKSIAFCVLQQKLNDDVFAELAVYY